MSTLTNKYGLPEAILTALQRDDYDAGASDITCTQLGNPPQLVALVWKHGESRDASEMLWALMGKAMHKVLEIAGEKSGDWTETRLFTKVRGWTVSGAYDVFDPKTSTLRDYKVCSYYAVKDGMKPEWSRQLQVLRWLLAVQDPPVMVQRLQIVTLFRDWTASGAERNGDYPSAPILTWDVPTEPLATTAEWVAERVRMHQHAQQALDLGDPLPPCSDSERWAKFDKKTGQTKYNRCGTPGGTGYCPVRHVCPQIAKASA